MQKQSGVGMVEVLVAALIMAIGILGYAAMQVKTLQEATNAQYRLQALALAGDLVARMRANGVAEERYVRSSYTAFVNEASCANMEVVCDSNALADADIFAIHQQLQRLLPGADISLERNPDNAGTLLVRVAWNGRAPTAAQCDAPVLNAENNFETYCITLEV